MFVDGPGSFKLMRGYQPVVIVFCLLVLQVGCVAQPTNNSSINQQQKAADDTVVTAQLQEAWQRRIASLDRLSPDYPKHKIDALLALLAETPKAHVASELERVRTSTLPYGNMSDYDRTLVQTFVAKLLKENERGRLVDLLAAKCPRSVGANPIELYLTVISMDNVLLLFDSYDKSGNRDSKEIILSALGAAFWKLREDHTADEEFISLSRDWYLKNRSKLKVNVYYQPNQRSRSTTDLFMVNN